jgi:hypothetical protein
LTTSVKVETVVLLSDWENQFLFTEIFDECSSDRTTNLELLDEDRSSDAEDLWNFLKHSLELFLLKIDEVIKLFLNLDLGP